MLSAVVTVYMTQFGSDATVFGNKGYYLYPLVFGHKTLNPWVESPTPVLKLRFTLAFLNLVASDYVTSWWGSHHLLDLKTWKTPVIIS
jgi:hypothetical protein